RQLRPLLRASGSRCCSGYRCTWRRPGSRQRGWCWNSRGQRGYEPGRPVLSDLSLVIVGPERVAVTGPNGSGKSTLLALIAGRLRPWAGTVRTAVDLALLDQ